MAHHPIHRKKCVEKIPAGSSQKPSEFFVQADPTPDAPGVYRLVKSAAYPKISYFSSIGLLPSSSGYAVWEQINAMSAYMNSLQPPSTGEPPNPSLYEEGKRVFSKAGCLSCHGGQYLTNNRLVKVEEIETDPSRARSFKKTERYFADPKLYSPDTPVPLPENPEKKEVKLTPEEQKSLKLGWAHGDSNGGYKIPSLYGLYWSAPYLHDGGVAMGKGGEPGLPLTLMKGMKADPYNSLQALIDSGIRKRVIESNLCSEKLRTARVTGKGHEYWVDDTTGFTKDQQKALIHYLLRLTD